MKIVLFGGLRPFNLRAALRDVFAGVTLASMNIPSATHGLPACPWLLGFTPCLTIAASAAFHFAESGIPVIGPIPGGLPSIELPDVTWSEVLALLPVAAADD
jgi:hypothetical protein